MSWAEVLLGGDNPYRPLPEVLRLSRGDFEFAISPRNLGAVNRRARWTVLLFLAADCADLCAPLFDNVLELKQVGSDEAVNICVFFAGPLLTDSFFARLNRGTPLPEDVVFRFLHVPTNEPGPLTEAIVNARAAFPAERELVVLAGHGLGWRGALRSDGVWRRYQAGKLVLPAPLEQCMGHLHGHYRGTLAAIRASLPPDARMEQVRPAVLALDACYMGGVETVAQFHDQAAILVLSEDQVPGEGYPYERILSALQADPGQDPEALAAQLVQHTKRAYQDGSRRRRQVTQVALRSAGAPAIFASIGALAAALSATLGTDGGVAELAESLDAAFCFAGQGTVDLKGLALQLADRSSDAAVRQAAAAVMRAQEQAILAAGVPGGPATPNGLSIYAPPPASFDPAYLRLVQNVPAGLQGWAQLLAAYTVRHLGGAAAQHPLVQAVGRLAPRGEK